jgi:hypothetical protein
MKLLLALVFFGFSLSAQISISEMKFQTGATLTDWDGLYNNSPGRYTPRWGYFVGGGMEVLLSPESNGFIDVSLKYRKTHTDRTTNQERIKLDELGLSIGPGLHWKKIKLGLSGSIFYVLAKNKISNALPGTGVNLETVEPFFASLRDAV